MQSHYEKKTYKLQSSASSEPAVRQSSSEIIKDAKHWCTLKAIETRRPTTPRDAQRLLFDHDRKKRNSRPPSAILLESPLFEFTDFSSQSKSGALGKSKLPPLVHKPILSGNPGNVVRVQSNSPSVQVANQPYRPQSHPSGSNISTSHDYAISQGATSWEQIHVLHNAGPSSSSSIFCPTPPPSKPNKDTPSAMVGAVIIPISEKEDTKSVSDDILKKSVETSLSCNFEEPESAREFRKKSPLLQNDGNTNDESASHSLYWNQKVLPVMEKVEAFEDKDVKELCKLCCILHDALESGSCFVHISPRRRTSTLTQLFRLLKVDSADVLLSCARIILKLGVRNQNFSSICKLIFRICRAQKHDHLFLEYHLISPMLSAMTDVSDPVSKRDNYEAYIYLSGSLKFLSDNKEVANVMYSYNCINTFMCFINAIMKVSKQQKIFEDKKRVYKYAKDLLVQVATTLRNVIDLDKKMLQTSASISILLSAFNYFGSDESIAWILSRIFSKLTMYNACIPHFQIEPSWPSAFLSALQTHQQLSDIVLRICFALGNLASCNDQLRNQLFSYQITGVSNNTGEAVENLNCLNIMLKLIDVYNKQTNPDIEQSMDIDSQATPGTSGSSMINDKAKDVLVKVVRVIANMSIGSQAGVHIACNVDCVEHLLHVLELRSANDNEELIVNVLTTLNNLSYYDGEVEEVFPGKESAISLSRLHLATLLSHLMIASNLTCMAEVAAVFGNLTRHKDVQAFVHQHKIGLMMVAMLDSGDEHVVYNACGVLVNMSSDCAYRPELLREHTISKLCDVLRDLASKHWKIGGLACQLIWNLTRDSSVTSQNQDELKLLVEILQHLLDVNAVHEMIEASGEIQETRGSHFLSWEEDFCPVSRSLLAAILNKSSSLEPLDNDDVMASYDDQIE